MKEPSNSNNPLKEKQSKEVWKTPEVVDLSINEGTQNTIKAPGRTLNDGGPAFTDYNS